LCDRCRADSDSVSATNRILCCASTGATAHRQLRATRSSQLRSCLLQTLSAALANDVWFPSGARVAFGLLPLPRDSPTAPIDEAGEAPAVEWLPLSEARCPVLVLSDRELGTALNVER